jgi:hypothetical protein
MMAKVMAEATWGRQHHDGRELSPFLSWSTWRADVSNARSDRSSEGVPPKSMPDRVLSLSADDVSTAHKMVPLRRSLIRDAAAGIIGKSTHGARLDA